MPLARVDMIEHDAFECISTPCLVPPRFRFENELVFLIASIVACPVEAQDRRLLPAARFGHAAGGRGHCKRRDGWTALGRHQSAAGEQVGSSAAADLLRG